MKKIVALDVQSLFENNKTGIGWTVKKIVDGLVANSLYHYQLNYFGNYHVNDDTVVQEYRQLGCDIRHCAWMEMPLYRRIWNWFPLPYRWMFGKSAQITQFFNCVIPPGVWGKKVLYIYDMAYKAYPETISRRTKMDLDRHLKRSCERAHVICTISEFSKSEIIKYLDVEEEKIYVVPCGVDYNFFHSNYDEEEIDKARKAYSIPKKYFLYLGTIEPRKNILRIVKAYQILKEKELKCPVLVIAGKKGWFYENIFNYVKQNGLDESIIFTGYIKTEEVPPLMQGAMCFVFPSLYEGFGLPVLEAMACGTPVLTSSSTSLQEIVSDAALLVNPLSIDEILGGLERLLKEGELRKQLSLRGREHCKKYSWENATASLENIYIQLLQ